MKRVLLIFMVICFAFISTACFDNGFEDEEDYYDAFNNRVYLGYLDDDLIEKHTDHASIEDAFFNEETVNHFDEDSLIDVECYTYMAVRLTGLDSIKIRDFGFYIRSEEDVILTMKVVVVNELPNHIRGYNCSKYKFNTSYLISPDDMEDIEYDPITMLPKMANFDDYYTEPICERSLALKSGEWNSFLAGDWNINGRRKTLLDLNEDQYLLVQFYNNTGYGRDEELDCFKFTMTNLLIGKD